jgi:hypothetical protein
MIHGTKGHVQIESLGSTVHSFDYGVCVGVWLCKELFLWLEGLAQATNVKYKIIPTSFLSLPPAFNVVVSLHGVVLFLWQPKKIRYRLMG